jgi:hypothetical protein
VKIDSNKMLQNDDDYEEGDSLIVRKMQEDQLKNVNIED